MTDMSKYIAPKSDQLNADDLISGPRVIIVTRVTANEATPEQPVSIFYEGDDGKPYKPCKSMRRVLVYCWGNDGNSYVGRSIRLYRDPEVTYGGIKTGGIRISHLSHIKQKMVLALATKRSQRAPYSVEPLEWASDLQPAPVEPATAAGFDLGEQQWVALAADLETKLKAATSLEALASNWKAIANDFKRLRDLDKQAAEALERLKDELKNDFSATLSE